MFRKGVFFLFLVLIIFGYSDIRPVPWLTEGAISFLEDFLTKNPSAKVLEFGSGASTIWFAKKKVKLFSVEHNLKWYNKINNILQNDPSCAPIQYFFRPRPYYTICETFPDEFFDLILVDGRNRKGCIYFSLPKLKKGGVLMLDNAERPYYFSVYNYMAEWKKFNAFQKKPDQCNFYYSKWLTSWWIKPL